MICAETVTVNAKAISWLKEKYPELCVKAGLCERVSGRLYTKTYTTPQPDKPAEQEPVAAQHRFRHPQKGTPDWSVWQPCKVAQRPAWEVDSQGYEVEYRALYTAPQPQREWVGLTDAEREEATGWSVEHIEAKLREKNGGGV